MSPKNTSNISSQQMIEWCKSIKNLATSNIKSIPKLIQKFPINTVDESDNTLLHYVSEVNSEEIVKYLMVAGFDVNAKNRRGETALVIAILQNNDKTVKTLISIGAIITNTYYPEFNGPLHIATDKGHVESIKVLLEAGCNVDAKNKKHNTPLIIAIDNRNIKVAKMLLDAGASRDHTYYRMGGPLHSACMSGHLEMFKLLLDAGYEVSALGTFKSTLLHTILLWHESSNDKEVISIIKLLIQAGVDVNDNRNDDLTPLYLAAEFGNNDAVDLLLNAGADPNAINEVGYTPLLIIAKLKYKNIFIARRLIEAGADINKTNFDDHSSVHLAVRWASVEILTLMVEHGAKFESVYYYMDPLGYALCEWNQENHRSYQEQASYKCLIQLDVMIENDQGTNKIQDQIKSIEIVCKLGLKINQIMDATDRYFQYYIHSDIMSTLLRQGLIVDFKNSKVDKILKTSNYVFKNLQHILIRHAAICNFYKKGDGIINFDLEKLNEEMMDDYENYIEELRNLKDFKVYESMPLSNLIEGPVTSRYILNERLIQLFETGHIERSFPTFKDILTKRFEEEKEKYELISKATAGLQSLMKLNQNSFSVIYHEILQYLETKDLHNIASLVNMETS